MLERDHIGMIPDTQTRQLPGGVAPARHGLARQRYTDEKQLRLAAEARARRRGRSVKPRRIAAALQGFAMAFARIVTGRGARPSDPARK
jgi:hypothetical protein